MNKLNTLLFLVLVSITSLSYGANCNSIDKQASTLISDLNIKEIKADKEAMEIPSLDQLGWFCLYIIDDEPDFGSAIIGFSNTIKKASNLLSEHMNSCSESLALSSLSSQIKYQKLALESQLTLLTNVFKACD